jgi:glucose dehydrogenase
LKHRLACAAIVIFSCALRCAAQSDWTGYGHDAGQTKYSPLDQINTSNVAQLKQVWVYHMKPAAEAAESTTGRRLLNSPATPLVIDGMMYLATPYSSVTALKPETGELIWTYKLAQSRFLGRSATYWPPALTECKDWPAHIPVCRQRISQPQGRDDRRSKQRGSLLHDLRGFHL